MEPIRLLLVDDHASFVRIVSDFLRSHADVAVVGVAPDSQVALAQAQALRPDVILIDLNMPGLSGLDAIPLLQTALPEVGIIVLTMHSTESYRAAALAAGADAFVSKATLDIHLLPAIRQVGAGRGSGRGPAGNSPQERDNTCV